MTAQVIRFPTVFDLRNAQARADWTKRFYGGRHYEDTRSPQQRRDGDWIALQVHWLRQGYRMLDRPRAWRHG